MELSAPRFVGRGGQRAALLQALTRPPAVVLIEGEAGVGKSRLLSECIAESSLGEPTVLVGRCSPHRSPATLAPIVEALRQIGCPLDTLPLTGLAGALRPLLPEWAEQLPAMPEPLDSAHAERYRLSRALAELVGGLGVQVLVLEDAHWADEASLEFLLLLATRRQRAQEFTLIFTFRLEEVPTGSLLRRLSSGLPADTQRMRIVLSPLDLAATAELASSMLGEQPVTDEFARRLHQHTDGLPLAVEESVRLLGDRGELVLREGQWSQHSSASLVVPPTVRDATLERAQRLDPAAQSVLQAAAVLGEVASESMLVEVAGLSGPAALAGVGDAVASGLLREEGVDRFSCRHVLSANAVYEAIPVSLRRRLHMRVGESLERWSPAPAVKLTRHFREAGDVARWAHYGERAADEAVSVSDHLTAVKLLQDLLDGGELPVADHARIGRKLGMAVLFMRVYEGSRVWEVAQRLRGILDSPGLDVRQRAEIGNVLGRLFLQLGADAEAFAELTRAVPYLGHEPVEAAHIMNMLGRPLLGPRPAAYHLRWLRRSAAVRVDGVSNADQLRLTVDRAFALLQLGASAGWQVVAGLPADADSGAGRLQLARGLQNVGDAAVLWGRYAEARSLLGNALELSKKSDYVRIRDCALTNLARLDWLTGAWHKLAERATAMMDIADIDLAAHLEAQRLVGLIEVAQGNSRVAERYFERCLAEGSGALQLELGPAATLAKLRLAQGNVAEALSLTDGPAQELVAKRVWMLLGEIAPVRVDALLQTGRASEAESLAGGFANGLRKRDAPGPRAALATCLALLTEHSGDHIAAAAAFARAARAWDVLPRPYDALQARERSAGCLLAAGRTEDGQALLIQVFDGLAQLGATGDADRVSRNLRTLGHTVEQPLRGGARGYGDQLSPRELEVVQLAATGKTNREIAQALWKSHGTIAQQLRSAMRKLGVTTRTALAVAAVEAGMVSMTSQAASYSTGAEDSDS